MNDIMKLIRQNDLLKVAIVLLAVYLFIKWNNKETLENTETPIAQGLTEESEPIQAIVAEETQEEAEIAAIVAGNDQLQADDLLPRYNEANDFAKQNPVSNLLKEQNFLISGYHSGINTVMQSNKIPYHDLRSAPPIPKETVGPWSQSSYETPMGNSRKFFEVGV